MLTEEIWFGDQDGIGVINNLIDIENDNFLQFRMRYCNHNESPHINTDLIYYGNNGNHGKCINKLIGFDVIAHEIDINNNKKKYKLKEGFNGHRNKNELD